MYKFCIFSSIYVLYCFPGVSPFYMKCEFESTNWENDASCKLNQVYGFDNFDWTRQSGSTPSSSTGPSSASQGSYYMYIETSSASYGQNAVLMSSEFNTSIYTFNI